MASSSVSQESLDREEYDFAARKSRVRALRSRGCPHKSGEPASEDPGIGEPEASRALADQDSPTRVAKEKRGRPNHLHKGRTAKDKRKLREKRRSTGVVNLPSESTGDSLDEEDKEAGETKRNTSYNEVIDADNPQTPEEVRATKLHGRNLCNKSPSDLEADLEDNQDYDSTISQSESNLATLGQSSPSPIPPSISRLPGRGSPDGCGILKRTTRSSHDDHARPVSYPSRYHEQDRDLENIQYTANSGAKMGISRLHRRPGDRDYDGQKRSINNLRSSSLESSESKILARNRELEKLLELERDSNRHLRAEKQELERMLEERDWKIKQLERELHLTHRDLDDADIENDKLQLENDALLRAMKSMTT